MKEIICPKCGKTYWGTRQGKCPTCICKAKHPKEPSKKGKIAWKVFKKVYKHMNTISVSKLGKKKRKPTKKS
jgi:hypothetical protein